jgi:hypothetical protein
MKRKMLLAGVFVLLITFAIGVTIVAADTDEVTIVGTVYASDWDDNDNVTAVSIETDDGAYYDVGNGAQLLKLVGKRVQVTGVVALDGEGNTIITVRTHKVLPQ